VLDPFSRAVRGDRTPEIELIAQGESSTEPGGARMIDLARALLNGPNVDSLSADNENSRFRDEPQYTHAE
jgi:hypothetical protein